MGEICSCSLPSAKKDVDILINELWYVDTGCIVQCVPHFSGCRVAMWLQRLPFRVIIYAEATETTDSRPKE